MDFRTDRRGQAVQVGAVLLLAVGIVVFATYQSTIIPNENAQIEYQHNQKAQSQMETVRNTIVSPPDRGLSRGVTLNLGTSYPGRIIGVNPGSPSGTVRTIGTTDSDIDIAVRNADAVDGTPSFFEGDTEFNSGALVYEPNYNEHQAPNTVYEHTALYNNESVSGRATITNPSMIDGDDITIVALDGSVLKSGSGTTALDVTTVDTSQRSLHLKNAGNNPLEIQFHSRKSASYWQLLAEDEQGEFIVDNGITSTDESNGWHEITIELQQDVTYDVTLTKVNVGGKEPDPETDGTKFSMVAYDNVTGTDDGFEEWSRHPKPTDDCESEGDDDDPGFHSSPFTTRSAGNVPFIGGVCRFGGPTSLSGNTNTERSYFLPEGKYEVGYTYYGLTSWDDDEKGVAEWRVAGNVEGSFSEEYQQSWSSDDGYIAEYDRNQETFTVDHPGGEATLRFTSTLNDGARNEAFGINDVWIRHADND